MAAVILEGTSELITTTRAVLLVCGVSVKEFTDSSFVEAELFEDLELDLNKWLGKAGLNYVTIVGQGAAAGASAEERSYYLNLKKYSKHYLAIAVIRTMSLGLAEQMSDGQNSMKRFFTDPDELMDRFRKVAEEAKDEILDASGKSNPVQTIMSGAGNDYDPVSDTEGN